MKFCTLLNEDAYSLRIGGKTDASLENGVLVESKRRMYRLFHKVKDYEKIQCYAYMKIFNVRKCILLETHNNEQAKHEIEWEDAYWNQLMIDLKNNYIENYLAA